MDHHHPRRTLKNLQLHLEQAWITTPTHQQQSSQAKFPSASFRNHSKLAA